MIIGKGNIAYGGAIGTSLSLTLSVGSQNSGIVVVIFSTNGGAAPSSVTCGGVAMTLLTNDSSNRCFMYYRTNPSSGNNTIEVTTSASCKFVVSSMFFYNVQTSSPFRTPVNKALVDLLIDVDATSISGDLVISGLAEYTPPNNSDRNTITVGTNQTIEMIWGVGDVSGSIRGALSTRSATTTTTNMSWSLDRDEENLGQVAAALIPEFGNSLSDSINITESVTVAGVISHVNVSDSISITETETLFEKYRLIYAQENVNMDDSFIQFEIKTYGDIILNAPITISDHVSNVFILSDIQKTEDITMTESLTLLVYSTPIVISVFDHMSVATENSVDSFLEIHKVDFMTITETEGIDSYHFTPEIPSSISVGKTTGTL
jgi:hypothetical protein